MKKKMVFKKTWKEFQESGLLWFVNTFLHTFGWSLVIEIDNGKIVNAYPARVKFRGFDETTNAKGYLNVTKYMKENAENLLKEAKE